MYDTAVGFVPVNGAKRKVQKQKAKRNFFCGFAIAMINKYKYKYKGTLTYGMIRTYQHDMITCTPVHITSYGYRYQGTVS
jgi:hypothetical protein